MKQFGNTLGLSLFGLFSLASVALAGNGSSGGGNLLPQDRISDQQFADVVSQARIVAEGYFDFVESYPERAGVPAPIFEKLFSRGLRVQDAVRQLRILVETERACFGEDQSDEKDGSYIDTSGLYPAVCLSKKRITSKLNKYEAPTQIWALFTHEVSHHMGLTEEEAEALQKLAAEAMVAGAHDQIRNARADAADHLVTLDATLTGIKLPLESPLSPEALKELLPEFNLQIQGIVDSAQDARSSVTVYTGNLSPIRKSGLSELLLLQFRATILSYSLCAASDPRKTWRSGCQQVLDNWFGSKEAISTEELEEIMEYPAGTLPSGTLSREIDQRGLQFQTNAISELISSILTKMDIVPVPKFSL